MRTTKRIAKKVAARFSASALSVPMILSHAKPSLWALPFGQRRHYVYRHTVKILGVHPRHAKWATWHYFRALALISGDTDA